MTFLTCQRISQWGTLTQHLQLWKHSTNGWITKFWKTQLPKHTCFAMHEKTMMKTHLQLLELDFISCQWISEKHNESVDEVSPWLQSTLNCITQHQISQNQHILFHQSQAAQEQCTDFQAQISSMWPFQSKFFFQHQSWQPIPLKMRWMTPLSNQNGNAQHIGTMMKQMMRENLKTMKWKWNSALEKVSQLQWMMIQISVSMQELLEETHAGNNQTWNSRMFFTMTTQPMNKVHNWWLITVFTNQWKQHKIWESQGNLTASSLIGMKPWLLEVHRKTIWWQCEKGKLQWFWKSVVFFRHCVSAILVGFGIVAWHFIMVLFNDSWGKEFTAFQMLHDCLFHCSWQCGSDMIWSHHVFMQNFLWLFLESHGNWPMFESFVHFLSSNFHCCVSNHGIFLIIDEIFICSGSLKHLSARAHCAIHPQKLHPNQMSSLLGLTLFWESDVSQTERVLHDKICSLHWWWIHGPIGGEILQWRLHLIQRHSPLIQTNWLPLIHDFLTSLWCILQEIAWFLILETIQGPNGDFVHVCNCVVSQDGNCHSVFIHVFRLMCFLQHCGSRGVWWVLTASVEAKGWIGGQVKKGFGQLFLATVCFPLILGCVLLVVQDIAWHSSKAIWTHSHNVECHPLQCQWFWWCVHPLNILNFKSLPWSSGKLNQIENGVKWGTPLNNHSQPEPECLLCVWPSTMEWFIRWMLANKGELKREQRHFCHWLVSLTDLRFCLTLQHSTWLFHHFLGLDILAREAVISHLHFLGTKNWFCFTLWALFPTPQSLHHWSWWFCTLTSQQRLELLLLSIFDVSVGKHFNSQSHHGAWSAIHCLHIGRKVIIAMGVQRCTIIQMLFHKWCLSHTALGTTRRHQRRQSTRHSNVVSAMPTMQWNQMSCGFSSTFPSSMHVWTLEGNSKDAFIVVLKHEWHFCPHLQCQRSDWEWQTTTTDDNRFIEDSLNLNNGRVIRTKWFRANLKRSSWKLSILLKQQVKSYQSFVFMGGFEKILLFCCWMHWFNLRNRREFYPDAWERIQRP